MSANFNKPSTDPSETQPKYLISRVCIINAHFNVPDFNLNVSTYTYITF